MPPVIMQRSADKVDISVIVCAANTDHFDIHRQHVEATVGMEYEYICIDNQRAKYSLSKAYNTCARYATTDILVFVHDDVFFVTPNWGRILAEKFSQQTDLGLIGVAGTAYLETRYPFWVAAKAPFIHGNVIHHQAQLRFSQYSRTEGDQDAVAVDGLMMATSKRAYLSHSFDEETFDGFHFYDIDYSVRVSETHRVIVTKDILVKHLSGGSFDEEWKAYRRKFREKYPSHKKWSAMEGEPLPGSHLQRLDCHHALETVMPPEQCARIESLGIEHRKHPRYRALPG